MYPYLMDSDHLSLISRGGEMSERITARIAALPPESVAVSLIGYEEQMRGWRKSPGCIALTVNSPLIRV